MHPINFEDLCLDYGIPIADLDHKHSRPGWINVECPFCSGNEGYHLGYDTTRGLFYCWRCKGHRTETTIRTLLKCSKSRLASILRQYRARPIPKYIKDSGTAQTALEWPTGTIPLNNRHKVYLAGRMFDAERLEYEWNLKGTGPIGPYKFRIIAPIYFGGQPVSYQGRDITGRSPLRYKACPKESEVREHQKCIYGLDKIRGNSVVVVEGITDVWRLGVGAVAVFGIDYTTTQVGLLSNFQRKFILFDSADPQAIRQAEKLAATLAAFGGLTEIIEIEDEDPGSMSQFEADELMEDLM